jgi:hypothetical protein
MIDLGISDPFKTGSHVLQKALACINKGIAGSIK